MMGDETGPSDAGGGSSREQDRFLPIANVGRIMKRTLPGNAKIAKDAKETMQEAVSEFISFITSECALLSALSVYLSSTFAADALSYLQGE